ncbi:MAG: transcriptional repressor [Rhodospirillaceae bacterium]
MPDEPKLTANQGLVLDRLRADGRALSAYEILDLVRGDGLRAPAQVYRALDRLIAAGLVHRLESLNAFIACAHDHGAPAETPAAVVFTICTRCGGVAEYTMPTIGKALSSQLGHEGFQPGHMTVEVSGQCAGCHD